MKAQILYISHGGGPMPILGDRYHLRMVDFLKGLSTKLKRPDAIVVLSAHWECPKPTLLCAQNPSLLYDYYGFPEEAYQLRYPSPMAVDLANHIASLFEDAVLDDTRGFDHGMFIPLSFLYPDADIPTTQLSLLSSLSSREHWNMGRPSDPCSMRIFYSSVRDSAFIICVCSFRMTTSRTMRSRSFSSTPVLQTYRFPNERKPWWLGSKLPTPATATPGKSTCCRCMSAALLPGRKPNWCSMMRFSNAGQSAFFGGSSNGGPDGLAG